MPINNITQTISELPAAGRRGVDVQTIFVTKQEDFQDRLQGTTVTELNTFKDQLNTRIGEINSTATTMNGYAATASAGASTATTKAEEASTSASEALTSRNQAETFKNSASTSAGQALTSRNQAETFAQQASASALSIDENKLVHRIGNETIDGVKTFTSSLIVLMPTTDFQVATKKYVDDLQDVSDSTAYTVEVIGDLITVPIGFNTVIVKDINRGGVFVSKTATEIDPNTGSIYTVNGGTVFAKLGGGFWVRQYSGAVNVKWFGAKGDGIEDDRLSFTKALLSSDSVLVPSGNTFLFDVTGGLTSAVEVVSNKTLIINGDIKSNYGELQDNPPSLFRVTGDNVSFYGTGSLIGNGYIDDRNMGTVEKSPSLIYVTGDNFKLKDVVIDTPSRVGILLYDCINADISTTFLGGVESYTIGNTAYFGVYGYLGGYHKIYDCVFKENSLGGKYISSIFLVNSNYCSITNNVAYGSWEKLIYCASSHTLIEGNSYHAPSPQNYTDAYRIIGNFNTLTGNYSIGANGGCQVLNGGNNSISNNTFLNCRQLGININDNENIGAGSLSGNEVKNNKITVLNGIAFGGIQVFCGYKSASYINIDGNSIIDVSLNTSSGAIVLSATSPYSIENSAVSDNNIINSYNGINLNRTVYSKISNNRLKNIVVYPFSLSGSGYNTIINNMSREVGYIGIIGQDSTINLRGNTFTDVPLSGSVTLASDTFTTTVAHGGVAPHARITLQNGNSPAGILQAITGLFTTNTGDGTFSIITGNYGNPTGNEILIYDIIQ